MASKYKAIKTVINGTRFDSKSEASYYLYLLSEESRGKIEIVSLQPKIYLTNARILYKPDFLIKENGKLIYIDVKGFVTPIFAIKKRLWVHYGAGVLRLVKGLKTIEEVKTLDII